MTRHNNRYTIASAAAIGRGGALNASQLADKEYQQQADKDVTPQKDIDDKEFGVFEDNEETLVYQNPLLLNNDINQVESKEEKTEGIEKQPPCKIYSSIEQRPRTSHNVLSRQADLRMPSASTASLYTKSFVRTS